MALLGICALALLVVIIYGVAVSNPDLVKRLMGVEDAGAADMYGEGMYYGEYGDGAFAGDYDEYGDGGLAEGDGGLAEGGDALIQPRTGGDEPSGDEEGALSSSVVAVG